ncbi:unnamed protein product [Moneuplotes crassus]|uniref:Uncharacterized protein n=1 Tax=Euplotes crassus TaxID=5936 RepID=A0AAD1X628_EUPCR|nr:unnamed protein product [Moneuplotes crassus]
MEMDNVYDLCRGFYADHFEDENNCGSMLNSNLNLNYSNQYYKSNLSISQNTNQPPSQTAQPDKPITDGVIFSKISKPQTITPNQEKTSSDNYQSRPTKAPKKPKTAAKRSKIPKRKRNILRDPHDKRSGTKLKSFNNNFPSKQRNRSKKSLDPNSNLEEGYCEILPLRSKERMNLMEKSTSFVKNRGLNKGNT